jgi:hypothetical protein
MGTQVDGFFKTFTFASAISAYRAVQPTSTAGGAQAAVTGATLAIGFTQEDVAAGDSGTVKLFHPTYFATVSGTCAVGDSLSFDASGLVTTLAANVISAGIALEAATETGAVIEIAVPLKVD